MPTIENRRSFRRCKTPSSRLCAGKELEGLIQVKSINPVGKDDYATDTLKQFATKRPICPETPCDYDFKWARKPQQSKRAQQKIDEELAKPYINVMADRRIVRGPNFARSLLDDVDPFDKSASIRRQRVLQKISNKFNCKSRNKRNVIGTVPPIAGRAHLDVQTDKYLEELVARPPVCSGNTQTDLYLECIPEPPHKPLKFGVDASTEIADGELFHFDAEAQPIIDVLVDGAIEYSVIEVAHEQEISAIRAHQEEYMAKREAELSELRRLEAEELRLQAEKERRLRQDRIANELDAEMQRAVVAAKLLQGHVSSLLPEIWENLEPASDAVAKDYMLKSLCPWLADEVKQETKNVIHSRNMLNAMIGEIVRDRAVIYGGYREPEPSISIDNEEEGEGENEACSCKISEIGGTTTDGECGPNDKKVGP